MRGLQQLSKLIQFKVDILCDAEIDKSVNTIYLTNLKTYNDVIMK